MLLRSDLHKLFATGYLTITPDYHVEVRPRFREEYHNRVEYYSSCTSRAQNQHRNSFPTFIYDRKTSISQIETTQATVDYFYFDDYKHLFHRL
jgi:hypothetical protein